MHISVVFFIFAIQAVCDFARGHKHPVQTFLDGVTFVDVEKRTLCTEEQKDKKPKASCVYWKGLGYCESDSMYIGFMTSNCYATCGNCEMPPTTPPPPPTGFSDFEVDKNACVEAHNIKRSLHEAPPLAWDNVLGQQAQQWADYLVSIGELKHSPSGENLYAKWGLNYATCEDAVTTWYEEEPLYDYANPGYSFSTGHFTQLVWKATRFVGVGLAIKRLESGYIDTYIVARYSPHGNVRGQFAANVLVEMGQPDIVG